LNDDEQRLNIHRRRIRQRTQAIRLFFAHPPHSAEPPLLDIPENPLVAAALAEDGAMLGNEMRPTITFLKRRDPRKRVGAVCSPMAICDN
jgi:hypothetical protein